MCLCKGTNLEQWQSLLIDDWLVLLKGGTFFARAAALSIAFLAIRCNGSGTSC